MKQTIKQAVRRFICRHFGHKMVEEVYAERWNNLYYHRSSRKPLYYVVRHTYCERCNEQHSEIISRPMRRSELLKEGWFLEDIDHYEPKGIF